MSDAYKLQGLDGFYPVDSGQLFSGKSRGFQVVTDGTFEATCLIGVTALTPDGTSTITKDLVAGQYVGGIVTLLEPTNGGSALVYPMDTDWNVGSL